MHKYKIILKRKNAKDYSILNNVTYYNDEVEEILNFLKQHLNKFTDVIRQALEHKDELLFGILMGALLNNKFTQNRHELQQLIANNKYEVLNLLSENGYTELLNLLLEIIQEQQIDRILILNLIKIAVANNHEDTVQLLMNIIFPK